MAAPQVKFVVVKRFTYRGQNEEWSNSYMLTGAKPSDNAAWRTLFDALVAEEKKLYTSGVSVIRGYGYDHMDDAATAVWSVDLTLPPNAVVPGTSGAAGTSKCAGDAALWVRWGLDRMNSKGKRVYLRKYYHEVFNSSGSNDVPLATQSANLTLFAGKMHDGTFVDGRTVTDKLGSAVVGHAVSPYITTRTLKRRGKRPGS